MNDHLVKQVEHRAIDELIPYARNARTHSDAQVAQLARSIAEFGFTNPVLVDADGGIIAGHGRVLAAKKLGMGKVPTLRVDWLTEPQRRAYVLADNQLALQAGWDEGLLSAELMALSEYGYDLSLTGFLDQELQELMRPSAVADANPDDCPDLNDSAVTSPGDIWRMGKHRLICGDSTDSTVIASLMDGSKADIVWTDPPYNVAYGDKAQMLNKNKNTGGQRITSTILNDDLNDADFCKFLSGFYRAIFPCVADGGGIYVAHSETERANFTREFLAAGFKLSGVVIWKKNTMVMGRSDYQWIHEPILYGWKPGAAHRWYGGRKNTTVIDMCASPFSKRADGRWEVHVGTSVFIVDGNAEVEEMLTSIIEEPKPQRSNIHPTMKPVALIERMLRNHVRSTDCVLDPFGGSGSTLIAAQRLGVRANLCELSPSYCDVIVRRWQKYTGHIATHGRTGAAFPEAA